MVMNRRNLIVIQPTFTGDIYVRTTSGDCVIEANDGAVANIESIVASNPDAYVDIKKPTFYKAQNEAGKWTVVCENIPCQDSVRDIETKVIDCQTQTIANDIVCLMRYKYTMASRAMNMAARAYIPQLEVVTV